MVVNGLKLPEAFVELISTPDLPYWFSLGLKEDVDAYGNHWQAHLELYRDQQRIEAETASVAEALKRHEEADAEMGVDPKEPPTEAGEPGFIRLFHVSNPFNVETPGDQERWAQHERLRAALDKFAS